MSNPTLHYARTFNNHWYMANSDKTFYMPDFFWALMKDSNAVETWCDNNYICYAALCQRLKTKDKVWFVGETKKNNPKSTRLIDEMSTSLKNRVPTDEVKKLLSEAEKLPPEVDKDNIYLYSLLFNQPSASETVEVPKKTNYSEEIERIKLEILETKLRILQAQTA